MCRSHNEGTTLHPKPHSDNDSTRKEGDSEITLTPYSSLGVAGKPGAHRPSLFQNEQRPPGVDVALVSLEHDDVVD